MTDRIRVGIERNVVCVQLRVVDAELVLAQIAFNVAVVALTYGNRLKRLVLGVAVAVFVKRVRL